jgi:UDP-glucose 4-epimerase
MITETSQKNQNIKTVVVTGAAGFIGGAICIELKKQGYRVIGIDRRKQDHLIPYYDMFIQDDFISYGSFNVTNHSKPHAVIHCAGTSLVGPSVIDPAEYYDNNVSKTSQYLRHIKDNSPATKFIFSSSASVYGSPDSAVVFEGSKTEPISPYGESKLMTEKMLYWFNKSYGMDYVAFRYFNACGAVEGGLHGQEPDATHIFARIFEAAITGNDFTLNGATFPTADGTCVRDYIHVTDIAKAHILAIEENIKGIYNIGSVKGYSNLEIFNKVEDFLIEEELIHFGMVMHIENPRDGDPAMLVANSDKLKNESSWKPEKDIDTIINDLNSWYQSKTFKQLTKRSPAFNPL